MKNIRCLNQISQAFIWNILEFNKHVDRLYFSVQSWILSGYGGLYYLCQWISISTSHPPPNICLFAALMYYRFVIYCNAWLPHLEYAYYIAVLLKCYNIHHWFVLCSFNKCQNKYDQTTLRCSCIFTKQVYESFRAFGGK